MTPGLAQKSEEEAEKEHRFEKSEKEKKKTCLGFCLSKLARSFDSSKKMFLLELSLFYWEKIQLECSSIKEIFVSLFEKYAIFSDIKRLTDLPNLTLKAI